MWCYFHSWLYLIVDGVVRNSTSMAFPCADIPFHKPLLKYCWNLEYFLFLKVFLTNVFNVQSFEMLHTTFSQTSLYPSSSPLASLARASSTIQFVPDSDNDMLHRHHYSPQIHSPVNNTFGNMNNFPSTTTSDTFQDDKQPETISEWPSSNPTANCNYLNAVNPLNYLQFEPQNYDEDSALCSRSPYHPFSNQSTTNDDVVMSNLTEQFTELHAFSTGNSLEEQLVITPSPCSVDMTRCGSSMSISSDYYSGLMSSDGAVGSQLLSSSAGPNRRSSEVSLPALQQTSTWQYMGNSSSMYASTMAGQSGMSGGRAGRRASVPILAGSMTAYQQKLQMRGRARLQQPQTSHLDAQRWQSPPLQTLKISGFNLDDQPIRGLVQEPRSVYEYPAMTTRRASAVSPFNLSQ